jgi:hypothetical protein
VKGSILDLSSAANPVDDIKGWAEDDSAYLLITTPAVDHVVRMNAYQLDALVDMVNRLQNELHPGANT